MGGGYRERDSALQLFVVSGEGEEEENVAGRDAYRLTLGVIIATYSGERSYLLISLTIQVFLAENHILQVRALALSLFLNFLRVVRQKMRYSRLIHN